MSAEDAQRSSQRSAEHLEEPPQPPPRFEIAIGCTGADCVGHGGSASDMLRRTSWSAHAGLVVATGDIIENADEEDTGTEDQCFSFVIHYF